MINKQRFLKHCLINRIPIYTILPLNQQNEVRSVSDNNGSGGGVAWGSQLLPPKLRWSSGHLQFVFAQERRQEGAQISSSLLCLFVTELIL